MVVEQLEHRRLAAAVAAASCARPPAIFPSRLRQRLTHQPNLSKWELTWRWTKSVGVLVLVAVALFVTVFYADNRSREHDTTKDDVRHLQKRASRLGDRLEKSQPGRGHFHNGITRIRKLHGSLAKSKNIILLSYHRSGANLLGEVLTLGANTAYFTEPFNPRRNNMSTMMIQAQLEGLLTCRQQILQKFLDTKPFRVIHKLGRWKGNVNGTVKPWRENSAVVTTKCSRTTVRVVESTRLHMNSILPLVRKQKNGDKWYVVHLIRDPRYVLDLRARGPETMSTPFCTALAQDLNLGKSLQKKQYFVIRYEDLHSNLLPTLRKLFGFLGLPWVYQAKEHVLKFQNKKNKAGENSKKIVSPVVLSKIERDCEQSLNFLGYTSPYKIRNNSDVRLTSFVSTTN